MTTRSTIRKTGISISLISLVSLILPLSSSLADGGVGFAISPRAYLTSIDTSDYSELATVPLFGLSITAGPKGGNWDLTINGLVGDGDSDTTWLFNDGWAGLDEGVFEIERTDYEALYRYRLNNSPVYIGFGARFVEVDEEYIAPGFGVLETNYTELALGEFAIGFSTQVSEGSRHSMFGNLLLGVGRFDYEQVELGEEDIFDDGSAFLVDANIGYQYVISEMISFSARYRVIAVQSSGEIDSQDTVQGPELAFTFRF